MTTIAGLRAELLCIAERLDGSDDGARLDGAVRALLAVAEAAEKHVELLVATNQLHADDAPLLQACARLKEMLND